MDTTNSFEDLSNSAPTELPLVDLIVIYRSEISLSQLESLRQEAEVIFGALSPTDGETIGRGAATLAMLHHAMSSCHKALAEIERALPIVSAKRHPDTYGLLMVLRASIQCYLGQYTSGKSSFDVAEQCFLANGSAMGSAIHNQFLAREYLRDRREYARATGLLNRALPVIRANPHAAIENLLTQAQCYLYRGDARRARDCIAQFEGLLQEHDNTWYLPEASLVKAFFATLEDNTRSAQRHCYEGIGHIADTGDLRVLAPLYLLLGSLLEAEKGREEDARDAYERALTTSEKRARHLHWAFALRSSGLHLRRGFVRVNQRARGSGYLFQATQLLEKMGLGDKYPQDQISLLPNLF
jgi:tetratricopeptide (TPR) repeat protein